MNGMLRQMPASLFVEWQAFDRIDPIGRERADLHAALIAATTENAARAVVGTLADKRLRPVQVDKYMPRFDRLHRPPQDGKTIYRAIKMALTLGRNLPRGA